MKINKMGSSEACMSYNEDKTCTKEVFKNLTLELKKLKEEKNNLQILNEVQNYMLCSLYFEELTEAFNFLANIFKASQVIAVTKDLGLVSTSTKVNLINIPQKLDKVWKNVKLNGHINLKKSIGIKEVFSFVEVPLYNEKKKIIGFIGIINNEKKINKKLLNLISNSLSIAFQNINQFRTLEHHSLYDLLTGVKNRNAYELYNKEYPKRDIRSSGVVVVDINGLKVCNDTIGHHAGDLLIQKVANYLLCIFGEDAVYRFGGDEFIVVCENLSCEEFNRLVEYFNTNINEVSISIGSAYSDKGIPLINLEKEADLNMYHNKELYYQNNVSLDRRKKYVSKNENSGERL